MLFEISEEKIDSREPAAGSVSVHRKHPVPTAREKSSRQFFAQMPSTNIHVAFGKFRPFVRAR
ncbi:unnamed protein product [Trichogramma brassicae]|uniref:Uncharacterized protein n=1 Tax=Trichogramma brassicae TaxID=86971 RepID=A0A6H5I3A3_9HYME|nr:unnamed protein product [Trichogramma brassicae]